MKEFRSFSREISSVIPHHLNAHSGNGRFPHYQRVRDPGNEEGDAEKEKGLKTRSC